MDRELIRGKLAGNLKTITQSVARYPELDSLPSHSDTENLKKVDSQNPET